MQSRRIVPVLASIAQTVLLAASAGAAEPATRPLTFVDLMQFRTIHDTVISNDGRWIAYSARPDRGDGEAVIRSTRRNHEYRIERGTTPQVTSDSRFAVASIQPTLEETEKQEQDTDDEKDKDNGPKTGLSIVDLSNGFELRVDRVESFALSEDGRWLAYKRFRDEEPDESTESAEDAGEAVKEGAEEEEEEEEEEVKTDEDAGGQLVLRELRSGHETHVEDVESYAFDELSTALAYVVRAPHGERNGAYLRRLEDNDPSVTTLIAIDGGRFTHLTWAREHSLLAYLAAPVEEKTPGDAVLWIWDGSATAVVSRDDLETGWTLPSKNELLWSRDGKRLFFGVKPVEPEDERTDDEDDADEKPFDPYDVEAIVERRGVDVWHWKDPRIKPNEKKEWEKTEKDRVYRAVYLVASRKAIRLADLDVRNVKATEHDARFLLAEADTPYLAEMTWDGKYADIYVVDSTSGTRSKVVERLSGTRSISPGGRFVVYYRDENWHLYDADTGATGNVTDALGVPFANEDHDYPQAAPGYGMAEWLADDSAVVIYDKYDIWQVPTDGSDPICLTDGLGRKRNTVFRIRDLDAKNDLLQPGSKLLLVGYHDLEKHDAFYGATLGQRGITKLYGTGQHRVRFYAKAEQADTILFARESYREFPDLWVSSTDLKKPRKLTDENPQIAEFAWGEAELVEWTSADGVPLQGILIKPGNYEPGKRYPLLVYYYRFFTQRLHQFNEPVINHRPSFPLYASNGYAVFLPDIRFQVGRPGFSATKCLVPGVQKLIEMGIADPDAIGLHGHSWSGYQTAFVITQTDIFKAAVAGAPVSNMTSAYSGIRWGTGLARQFQYEKSQSRIGGSLWEYPERYIENSPVFFADRITTPLLIEFGDKDEAVPWYQGIELYLAMRRLGKECVFLQYRGEPHHLKKYPNKLDYSIKMKQFFDHHLKGEPAPKWMTEGIPFRGK